MNKIKIFVYGTLMNGERANHMLKAGRYIGQYRLMDYGMFDLGAYPGIKPMKGECVIGEVYEITEDILPILDNYEGEGYLYNRTISELTNSIETIKAYVYIYNQPVEGKTLVRGKWNAKGSDYVWYAAYGSNLSEERFRNYIEGGVYRLTGKCCNGCTDKSLWKDERVKSYKGEMYYGNTSQTWEGKGVAFYDSSKEGLVKMKLYKITREQLLQIQMMEGCSPNWYGKCECIDILEDNCEVYTLTSETSRTPKAPSDKYYGLIMHELAKM